MAATLTLLTFMVTVFIWLLKVKCDHPASIALVLPISIAVSESSFSGLSYHEPWNTEEISSQFLRDPVVPSSVHSLPPSPRLHRIFTNDFLRKMNGLQ